MENINHITFNTRNVAQYKDDSEIPEDVRPIIHEIAANAIKKGKIEIFGGVKLDCIVCANAKAYLATLYVDKPMNSPAPVASLLETAGAVDEFGSKMLWPEMELLYKKTHLGIKTALDVKCPQTPYICDVLFPAFRFRIDVSMWSGFFTKCFGIEMLKMLSEKGSGQEAG